MCTIRPATTADDLVAFGALVREYVASLPFVLDFQDVDAELASLAEEYGPPGGGALLAEIDGSPVGCVAIKALEPPEVAEMKRMYVRPTARGRGLGRALAVAALAVATELGYEVVRLDTVAELTEAAALYRDLGFVQIAPYRHNPIPSARFYEVTLQASAR